MNVSELSPSQLRQAAALKEQMARLQVELDSILGTSTPTSTASTVTKKRTMSAAARALISAAQKARWDKLKGAKPAKVAPPTASAPKKKWKLSAAGKARIRAASKAYWAAKKAAAQK